MTGRHIVRQAGIGAAGDDDPDTRRRAAGQQGGDAGPSPGRSGPGVVLIEPVHHDDKPPPPFFGLSCCRCQQAQPRARPRPRHRRRSPAGRVQGSELLDHGVQERVAVGLAGQAAGDEERHDVDPGRGMGDEPRRQRALTCPRPGLPPGVRLRAGAELGPLRQLAVAADQRVGGDVTDLFQVGRPDELPGSGRDDIRQSADGRRQPEPVHQPAEVSLRQLVVGPVDAPGGEPAGRPRWGDARPPRRRSGRRPTPRPPTCPPTARDPRLRRGGRRVVQVDGQGALTAVGRHRRMPGHLLQIPEHPRLALVQRQRRAA